MHQRVWRNEQRQYLLLLIFLPSRTNRFLVLTFVNLRGFPCLNWVYILSSFSGLYFSGWLCLISASFGLCHSYSGVLMSICLIYVFPLPLIESFIHYPHFVKPSFALFQCNLNYITSIFQKCRKKMNIELSSF